METKQNKIEVLMNISIMLIWKLYITELKKLILQRFMYCSSNYEYQIKMQLALNWKKNFHRKVGIALSK